MFATVIPLKLGLKLSDGYYTPLRLMSCYGYSIKIRIETLFIRHVGYLLITACYGYSIKIRIETVFHLFPQN